MSMSLQFKTFYSDAACTVPIRVSFPPGACENIRLDTSCRQDSGYFSRSSCAATVATIANDAFGQVPLAQLLYNLSCTKNQFDGPSASFLYPINKCVPNIEHNTYSLPKPNNLTLPTDEPINFSYEMVDAQLTLTGYTDANCQTKAGEGYDLNKILKQCNSTGGTTKSGSPLMAVDTYFQKGSTVPDTISVYPMVNCTDSGKADSSTGSSGSPFVRQCIAADLGWSSTATTKMPTPYLFVRNGTCSPPSAAISSLTSMFATVLEKCVAASSLTTGKQVFSISKLSTAANKTSYVTTTTFENENCSGNAVETRIYDFPYRPPVFDDLRPWLCDSPMLAQLKLSAGVSFAKMEGFIMLVVVFSF
ncbi:hypothetical protein BDR26DRAFT_861543, partial [Obelidium mucronatum]